MKSFDFQRYVSALCLAASAAGLLFAAGCGQTSPGSAPAHTPSSASSSGAEGSSYDFSAPASESSGVRTSNSSTSTPSSAGIGHPEDMRFTDETTSDSIPAEAAKAASGRAEEKSFSPRNNRQSGLLTAGSFDDVRNFTEFTAAISRASHITSLAQLPVNLHTHQTVITVSDGQGRPLPDIKCVVTVSDESQEQQGNRPLVSLRTGSDGRTSLLTSSRLSQQCRYRIRLYATDNEQPLFDDVRDSADEWQITLNQLESSQPTQLDLAIVIDTTGSMQDELDYLKAEIDSISKSVAKLFPNVEQRYALITYRDQGDEYVCRTHDFSPSLTDFRRHLDAESAGGGGDFPEAVDVALDAAASLNWRTSNTARVMFLVGDAPPHAERTPEAIKAVDNLRQQGVRVFPVGASGMDKAAEIILRTASLMTLGEYLFLTDHSGVGNPHAKPDVSSYAVERLDRLMIRMIASELAGKRLVPEEIIAIERGDCTWEQLHSRRHRPQLRQPHHGLQQPHHQPLVREPAPCPPTLQSLSSSMLIWIRGHLGSVLIATITGVLAFDGLKRRSARTISRPKSDCHHQREEPGR